MRLVEHVAVDLNNANNVIKHKIWIVGYNYVLR